MSPSLEIGSGLTEARGSVMFYKLIFKDMMLFILARVFKIIFFS